MEESTDLLFSFIARGSYLQPQTVHQTEISEISFARFTQAIHEDLPDNHSGHQETLVMQQIPRKRPPVESSRYNPEAAQYALYLHSSAVVRSLQGAQIVYFLKYYKTYSTSNAAVHKSY
jgi:hypothetical protein